MDCQKSELRKKNKICFFNTTKVWGGGEKWHFDNAINLHNKKYSIIVVTNKKSKLFQHLHSTNIPIKSFWVTNFSFLNLYKILKLSVFLKKQQINTLILNLSSDVKVAGLAAKLAGVKNIIYRRGSAIPIRNTIFNRYIFKNIITDILANSQATKNTILENNKNLFPANKIKVIYNGIDIKKIDSQKIKLLYSRQNNELILGNAGRLEKQKGQKNLILIAEIFKNQNIDFKILIAGDGRLKQELIDFAIEKNVLDKIIFLGFVKNIKNFMETIDIFILTSYWEGFGYVIAEAMVSKKPSVAFDLSSNPELISDGETGFLVSINDITEFCNKIIEIYKNKILSKKMGKNARKIVEEKFDTSVAFNNFENWVIQSGFHL